MTSGYLEADFIADRECHVSFDIIFAVRQKETLAAVFVADPSLLTGSQFGSDGTSDSFFAQYLIHLINDNELFQQLK